MVGSGNGLAEVLSGFGSLCHDIPFRNFVVARALLVGTGLSTHFLVVMAHERSDTALIFFLTAQGPASLLSGHFRGKFADRSSRRWLLACRAGVAVLGLCIFIVDYGAADLTRTQWFLPACFFVLRVLHDGGSAGTKNVSGGLGRNR